MSAEKSVSKPSWGQTVRAVAWSLIGLRPAAEFQKDQQVLKPLHVMFVAVVAVILFVLVLMGFVHWLTQSL